MRMPWYDDPNECHDYRRMSKGFGCENDPEVQESIRKAIDSCQIENGRWDNRFLKSMCVPFCGRLAPFRHWKQKLIMYGIHQRILAAVQRWNEWTAQKAEEAMHAVAGSM